MDALDRLERLLAEATERPWRVKNEGRYGVWIQRLRHGAWGAVARIQHAGKERDAALIVALRNAAPELIQVARAARAACDSGKPRHIYALQDALAALARKLDGPPKGKP